MADSTIKTADKTTTWVRAPIFNYLRVCPLPEAKKHLEELAKLDLDMKALEKLGTVQELTLEEVFGY